MISGVSCHCRSITKLGSTLTNRFARVIHVIRSLGLIGTVSYINSCLRRKPFLEPTPFILRSKYAAHPLRCRPRSSDIDVFRQIFIDREYSCLDDLKNVSTIVDCGAYAGFSGAYFLTRFPSSTVIAIEPDPDNFAAMVANLTPYGSRLRTIQAAVWSSSSSKLVISSEPYRDGREWARQVRESSTGEGMPVRAITIQEIIKKYNIDRISILKVDIEGSEARMFSHECEVWLDKVDTIVIELHDDTVFGRASEQFFKAIGQAFLVTQCGELTVCKRISSGTSHPRTD